jgi:NADPH:quinone reductase-like Zn-dependent oxidoreductase
MKALVIHRYGTNDVVSLEDVPDPALRPRDVLIETHAASVNPVDFKLRSGKLKAVRAFDFPIILGCDVSGVVKQVGPEVTKFKPGDAVFASLENDRLGAFAERVAADESVVAKKPASLDHEAAAAIPLVGLTSWQALAEHGKVGTGSKVLIHAGAGGIGTIAIQIAKRLGAHVATTTSTKNVELVKSLGADTVIDYIKQDFSRVISDYDVVFETLGGDVEIRSFDVLKKGGTMVSIAGLPDATWAKANGMGLVIVLALRLMTWRRTRAAKRRGVHFVFFLKRSDGAQLAMLASLADQGKLNPIVDKVYRFEDAKDALAFVESGRARGKVVIKVK